MLTWQAQMTIELLLLILQLNFISGIDDLGKVMTFATPGDDDTHLYIFQFEKKIILNLKPLFYHNVVHCTY